MPTIALNFEDGVTRVIEARDGETVADASYRQGINIPLDCRDGACGTCKCRVTCGAFEEGFYIEEALTEDEAAEGFALACQAVATSDLVVDIAASSALCKTKAQTYQATIAAVERLSETTLAFTLEGAGAVGFLPGQYVNLGVPGTGETRSYSFASAPGDDRLAFLIRDIPGGKMSGFIRAAEPGAAVEFTGPSGSFYLRDVTRPVLFLAGGTGLAPFLSMLRQMAAKGTNGQPVHLVYGVTRDADLVEVATLERWPPRCRASPSRPSWRTSVEPSAQGLRHRPSRGGPAQRRRDRRLPLRPAADGRRGARLAEGAGHRARRLPHREVRGERQRRRAAEARQLIPARRAKRRPPPQDTDPPRACARPGGGVPAMNAPARLDAAAAVTPGRFANKVAIVTGAAQGIGREVALRLAAEGGRLVAVDRSEIVREVADATGGLAVEADLETWEGAEAAVQAALDAHGRLDILINNVGGAIWMKPFDRFEPAEIEAEIRRSLLPTLWCCRAALPAMGRAA
jgi:benzoate/toluate 1,2-dioxygenase reductase component